MNFFEQQDISRRNTRYLVLLMALAVISLIALTTLLVAAVLFFNSEPGGPSFWQSLGRTLSWDVLGTIAAVVLAVVVMGTLYKLSQLRGGGKRVAESLGGQRIPQDTRDPDERKILNVVEEMAIASGIGVPPVYLLEDQSINAFAAGYNPQDAVIGVTRGCIAQLNRDELQGVVAHEFSHIFHGDMRLNMRLVAILNGIMLIGLVGYMVLRGSIGSSLHGRRRSSGRGGGKNAAAGLALGLGLIVIGYVGTFFGNLIKAAVSRQREFLADASAVQFTRNPHGISGALKKIGGYASGSKIDNSAASEFSHMYFSQGVSTAFSGLMATHPPLQERVKRIDPRWDGKMAAATPSDGDSGSSEQVSGFSAGAPQSGAAPETPAPSEAGELHSADLERNVEAIGQPNSEHLAHARQSLAVLAGPLAEAAHEPFSARAVVYGLLLSEEPSVRDQQVASLKELGNPQTVAALEELQARLTGLSAEHRLPLLEMALPALKQMSEEQYRTFKQCLVTLIKADNRISLLEWSLYRIIRHNLESQPEHGPRRNLRHKREECQLLLSVLARSGADSEAEAERAFAHGAQELQMSAMALLPAGDIQLPKLDGALKALNRVKPLQKPQLLKAMARCVEHSGRVTPTEAELFRAMADSLDCPVPPLTTQREAQAR